MNFFKKADSNDESNYRKHGDNTLIILIVFSVIAIFGGISIYNGSISRKCNNFESSSIDAGFKFAMNNNLLPSYEGTSIKINLNAVPEWNNEFRKSNCSGTLNIIKTNNGYAKELDLTDCNKCTTSKKKLGKETEKYNDNKNIVRVTITYNYRNRQLNYTSWTDWYESSDISPNISEHSINLPYDEDKYPKIPEKGVLVGYEVDTKTFYSYRDTSWKFYKNANSSYSTFSSTKPTNYAYKDIKTEIIGTPSDWSLNYPSEEEYRTINKAKGYKYYYLDEDDKKIYYNNGNYTVKIEDQQLAKLYNQKEKDNVDMYSYTDKMWKWYNGTPREYSSFMNSANSTYPYKDNDLVKYNDWSKWAETSTLNSSNASYRQEKIDIHSRYRAKYSFDSEDILNSYMNLQDFEKATNRAVSDMQQDENINVLIKYTYRYSK